MIPPSVSLSVSRVTVGECSPDGTTVNIATCWNCYNYYWHCDAKLSFSGLLVMVNDITNMTDWFLSNDSTAQSFGGVQLLKRNDSLVFSFTSGTSL